MALPNFITPLKTYFESTTATSGGMPNLSNMMNAMSSPPLMSTYGWHSWPERDIG